MKTHLHLFLGIALIWLGGTPTLEACSCIEMSVCEAFSRASVVITGRVVDERGVEGQSAYRIEVSRTYKGSDQPVVEVYTDRQTSCAMALAVGVEYLIFAHEQGDELWTGMCTRTSPIRHAQDDLAVLEILHKATGGTLVVRVHGVSSPSPVINVSVYVQGVDDNSRSSTELTTDSNGRYELAGLAPGRYRVWHRIADGSATDRHVDTVTVERGRCAISRFRIVPATSSRERRALEEHDVEFVVRNSAPANAKERTFVQVKLEDDQPWQQIYADSSGKFVLSTYAGVCFQARAVIMDAESRQSAGPWVFSTADRDVRAIELSLP